MYSKHLAPLCAAALVLSPLPAMAQLRDKTYAPETLIQAQPKQISPAAIAPVATTGGGLPPLPSAPGVESAMPIIRPPLQALISIQRCIDPYNMDAAYAEPVGLKDVLLAAQQGNLDIRSSLANNQIQKYTYLSALTRFLPDANAGYQRLQLNGKLVLPFATAPGSSGAARLHNGFSVVHAGFTYRAFQGGSVLFTALQNRHNYRAARAQSNATMNDTLLASARQYYNLLLQDALLHIRIRAVETSAEQLRMNTELEANGLATSLDVLQARTQLSRDRQNLIDQQSNRRTAALQLARTLNISLAQDLIPAETEVHKVKLLSDDIGIGDLLKLAVDNRPELKQYEELRQAAKAAIGVAAAPLMPSVTLSGNEYGLGRNLNHASGLWVLNLNVNWTLGAMGLTDAMNIQTAKWRARQAQINASRQFADVFEQVRNSYVNSLASERRIEETNDEVVSAQEELRLSRLRLQHGLGTNLDVLTAQRDLTQAYIDKAQAIVTFNLAQTQILHDVGIINVERLISSRPVTKM